MDTKDLIALESKIAYGEKQMEELSAEMYRMQREMDRLKGKVTELEAAIRKRADVEGGGDARDERPPHY